MDTKNETLKLYDEIMATVVANVTNEMALTNNEIYLKWFNKDKSAHRVYFYGAMIAADVYKKKVYFDMPFHKYLILKCKNWKRHKQMKWIRESKVPLKATPIQEIINHMEIFYGLRPDANQLWNNLLITYYEPIKEK